MSIEHEPPEDKPPDIKKAVPDFYSIGILIFPFLDELKKRSFKQHEQRERKEF